MLTSILNETALMDAYDNSHTNGVRFVDTW